MRYNTKQFSQKEKIMWIRKRGSDEDISSVIDRESTTSSTRSVKLKKKLTWLKTRKLKIRKRFRQRKRRGDKDGDKDGDVTEEVQVKTDSDLERQYLDLIRQESNISTWVRQREYNDDLSDELIGTVADVVVSFNQVARVFSIGNTFGTESSSITQ